MNDDKYYIYSKLFKYILKKHFDPEIIENGNCLIYKINLHNKKSSLFYYNTLTHEWSSSGTYCLSAKSLLYECVRFANFIGYE
jgi:hypothetical protein